MSVFSSRLILALVLAALCLSGRTAHAQANPLTYWTPGWPAGGGGDPADSQSPNTYGNFPSFDGSDARGGVFRYNFSNGWFVGSERGAGFSMNGIGQNAAFGGVGSLYSQGAQFGYNFKGAGGLPVTVFAGFDTLKYDGIGGAVAPFGAMSGGTLPGYGAHAGFEVRPTSNLTLSLGVGYTQQSGRIDSDINSPLLPGASLLAVGGHR